MDGSRGRSAGDGEVVLTVSRGDARLSRLERRERGLSLDGPLSARGGPFIEENDRLDQSVRAREEGVA